MPDPAAAPARSAIERLLRPRSVAIVGASPSPGSLGAGVMANLGRFGFKGDVFLVNQNRREIDGRPCLASAQDLPMGVDCAVLAIPRAGIRDAVIACAGRNVGGVIVFSGGFAEAGAEGRALQEEIAALGRAGGLVIEGPNCLGLVNNVDGIALTFGVAVPLPLGGRPGIGIVSQSGAMATALRTALAAHEMGTSFSISTGNEASTGIEDYFDYLIDDASTAIVALIVEQFRDPKRARALARRAQERGKPVVVLHPGRSRAAQLSAQTHTAAMCGDYQVMRAVLTHEGVIFADTIEELIDISELLARFPHPPRDGIAVVTESGIFKGIALDYCEALNLPVAELTAGTIAAIDKLAPGLIAPTNPLDLTAQGIVDLSLFPNAMRALLADEHTGCVVLNAMCTHPLMVQRRMPPVIEALRQEAPSKPLIFTMMGDDVEVPADIIRGFRDLNVPFFRSPERALRALARVYEHDRRKPRPRRTADTAAGAPSLASGVIPEHRSKAILAEVGIPFPKGALVRDLASARRAADGIGYPVALKAQSSGLSHKSDAGGVVLGISDGGALSAAWEKLHADIAHARPDLALDGILVEAMKPKGMELILGARNDPDWGAVLAVGLGGIFAEALGDMRVLPADFAADAIADEIMQLEGAKALSGFRSAAVADVRAAADVAARLAAFVLQHPEIAEVDLNPVVVYPAGQGAMALDALIVVR